MKLKKFIELPEHYCIFMEFIEGKTLSNLIKSNDRLTEKHAKHIFSQLISLVSFLHKNEVYHRDVKPSNIIVQSNLSIKLIDFGLSSLNSKLLSTYCGSFQYAAPECIQCQPYKGSSADMWSLGVVLFVMISKRSPWKDSNLKRMTNQIFNVKNQNSKRNTK
jgi:serine/threonine protein kinase